MGTPEHFDAVVIGSGFGGSVMTYRLAEAGLRVCLLERGKSYPPGSFARSPLDMRNNFWDPSNGKHGLFQIWKFEGIDGIVSSGLGGGSLIYANVFIRKDERWFYRRDAAGNLHEWPVTRTDLDPHYDRVQSVIKLQRFPFEHQPYSNTPKTIAMRDGATAAGLDWFLPELAVTFGGPQGPPIPGEPIRNDHGVTTDNLHGRTRYTCRLCGECDIGCNYGSKNTLDYTYLTLAQRVGAELRERCEVRTFAPIEGGGYSVRYVFHDPADEGRPTKGHRLPNVEITADRLILAAGTFGTAYLMLKNRTSFPGLSGRLGEFFSGNGDNLGLLLNARRTVGARKVPRVLDPSRGPVITSTIRVPDTADGGTGPGYYVQDGGYPGFVDWLAEETDLGGLLRRVLAALGQEAIGVVKHSKRPSIDDLIEELIRDAHASSTLLPLLGMGLDTPGGQLSLDDDNLLQLTWSSKDSREFFDRVTETMRDLAKSLGAKFKEDPITRLRHKYITVHPVGGCSMARSADQGVVSPNGEVFGYPGLAIADGSVMPGPVGPNPSFTIAALADRFADRLLA